MSTVTRILPPLLTAVKQYEFENNLTNNLSLSSVLNQQNISLHHLQNHFKPIITLLVLAKIGIVLRTNYSCAHALFKVQVKTDYKKSNQ